MSTATVRAGTGTRRTGATAAFVAAACYSSFLLSPLAGSTGGLTRGFVSELESPGQPFAWFYRLTDIVAGFAIIAVAAALFGTLRRWRAVGTGLLASVGLASALDGFTSMRCDPSLDASCAAGEHSVGGLIGQLIAVHTDTGMIGFLGALAGAIVLGAASVDRHPACGRIQIGLGVAIGLCGLGDLILLITRADVGAVERLRVLLTSAWLAVIGCCLGQPGALSKTVDPAAR